jgi:hypothetical protein
MDAHAMRDVPDRDKSLVELRALLASYEERLSRSPDGTLDSWAAQAHIPAPLLLLNDVAMDLRPSALESCAVIEAPGLLDCFPPEQPEPFSFVSKISSGVFRLHPRQGRLTAAVIGPFSGPAPSGLIATAQTAHGSAPAVRFHISIWLGECDRSTIEAKFGDWQGARSLTVPPRHRGFLVATDSPRSGPTPASSESGWGLLLATMADPPEEISFAWAEFSDIVLTFATDSGVELRRLL